MRTIRALPKIPGQLELVQKKEGKNPNWCLEWHRLHKGWKELGLTNTGQRLKLCLCAHTAPKLHSRIFQEGARQDDALKCKFHRQDLGSMEARH